MHHRASTLRGHHHGLDCGFDVLVAVTVIWQSQKITARLVQGRDLRTVG
jgi:hypothetical protein